MRGLKRWLRRVRVLARKNAVESELEEEMRFHLEMEMEKNVRLGMSPKAARRAAALAFGAVDGAKEEVRAARWVSPLEALWWDCRQAARGIGRRPGLALPVIVMLSMGIGATSAWFGLLNALLLRMPPGIERSDGLVRISNSGVGQVFSYPEILDMAGAAGQVVEIAAFQSINVALGGGEPLRIPAGMVSGNYFDLLSAAPALGRGFRAEEDDRALAQPVAVLGYTLWQRRFGGDPAVIGRTVTINGNAVTVVGVARPGFVGTEFDEPAELWVPIAMQPIVMAREWDVLGSRETRTFRAVGRLAGGVTPAQAAAFLAAALRPPEASAAAPSPPRRPLQVTPLSGWAPPGALQMMLPIIGLGSILTGLVLLVAWANVANLLLARGLARRREIGVRLALGSGRARLVRVLTLEAVFLALGGGLLGLYLGFVAADWFQRSFREGAVSGPAAPLEVSPDLRTFAVTLCLALGSGVLFGLAPAIRSSRQDITAAIRGEVVPGGRRRLQRALVVVQIAFSLVLLVAAGLFVRRVEESARRDPGFQVDGLLTGSIDLFTLAYPPEGRVGFYREMRERVGGLPGVESVVVPTYVPFATGAALFGIASPEDDAASSGSAIGVSVGTGYFETLQLPVVRGRSLQAADLEPGSASVVVSESFARRYLKPGDPVGQRFRFTGTGEMQEVVGVARDVALDVTGPVSDPYVYLPANRGYLTTDAGFLIRSEGDLETTAASVRAVIRAMDPNVPVLNVRPLAQVVTEQLGLQRNLAAVVAGLGAIALALAALGLYALISFAVAARTREFGIRTAVGATFSRIVRLVVADGLRVAAIGIFFGAVLSVAVGRLIGSLLTGVRPLDPLVLIPAAAMLGSIAFLASYLPARRAARVDPTVALRLE